MVARPQLAGDAVWDQRVKTLNVFTLKEGEMTKRGTREAVNFFRDMDDMAKIISGHRIPDLAARGMQLLGITERIENQVKTSRTGPYAVLGVRDDAADLVVKAAFRSLQRRYHPDTGLEPDDIKSKAINQALSEIEELRGWKL